MEVMCILHDASMVFNFIQENAVDLLIYDISFNESISLDIIKDCKKDNGNMRVIIIGGSRDFDYFKRAFRLGISDFLTAPLSSADLNFSLRNIRENHIKKIEQFIMYQNAQNEDGMRSKFFSELLFRKTSLNGLTIDSVNNEYCFKFSSGSFQAAIIKLDLPLNSRDIMAINSFIQKLMISLRKSLNSLCFDLQLYAQGSRIYAIQNYKKTYYSEIKEQFLSLVKEFYKYDDVLGKSITVGLGSSVSDINSLVYSLFEAEAAVAQRIIDGTGKIIENVIEMPNNLLSNIILTNFYRTGYFAEDNLLNFERYPAIDIFLEKAKSIFKVLKKDRLEAALNIFEKDILGIPLKGIEFLAVMQRICRDCINYLSGHNLCVYELEQQFFTYNQKADLCKSRSELLQLFSKTLLIALETVYKNFEDQETKPIRLAKQYIQQNFFDTLTLEIVSEVVDLNPAYLSTLFKKESGKSFSDYIFEVRMANAQEMLKKTNLKIDAICGNVGYMDIKHFTQSFKKFSGFNPSEYRKFFS